MAAGGADGSMSIWDVSRGELRSTIPHGGQCQGNRSNSFSGSSRDSFSSTGSEKQIGSAVTSVCWNPGSVLTLGGPLLSCDRLGRVTSWGTHSLS